MFKWVIKNDKIAQNAIFLEDKEGQEGRPFKSRFLQAGLVKYDFGVCLLQKETIDKFTGTFVECPVIIDHQDDIKPEDVRGTINKIWFNAEDGWFWCSGILTDEDAIKLVEKGYNVSCQYRITDYSDNTEGKLHNGNPYDKEILNGVFEHLAIVKNPRYEGAFIAVNAVMADDVVCRNEKDFNEDDHPRDDEGKFAEGENTVNPNYEKELKEVIDKAKNKPNERQKLVIGKVSDKLASDAKTHGFDINGYSHDLDVSGTRHAFKHHDNPKIEDKRGQIAITDEDFEKIPDVVYGYDSVEFGEKDNNGTPLIKYKKTYQDGTTIYVEEIRSRQKTLTIKSMYKTKKASNACSFTEFIPQRPAYTSNIIITDLKEDFNPNVTINKATNEIEKYNPVFEWIRNYKTGGIMDKETKGLFSSLIEALKASNEADEEGKKDEKEAKNEDVDKRKLIGEVGGILKGKVDDEIIRTIIAKLEKVAYDKSEAGTADNEADEEKEDKKPAEKEADKEEAENKCKNEEDEEAYEELKEKVEKEAENKKAKNSLDALKAVFFEGGVKKEKSYMSQREGIELGKKLY